MTAMWNKLSPFWKDTLERVLRTMAQTAAAEIKVWMALAAASTAVARPEFIDFQWVGLVTLMSGIDCVLTCLAGSRIGSPNSPSLLK
jgi:hypothetical protein